MGQSLELVPPDDFLLEVYFYLGPSFKRSASNEWISNHTFLAKRIVKYTKSAFLHQSLGTRVHLHPTFIDTIDDQNTLPDFSSSIPEKNLKVGRLHARLLGDNISINDEEGTTGVANMPAVCGNYHQNLN